VGVANCSRCGKLFRKVTSDICPKCKKEEEELLGQTREYLRQNPQALIYDIVDDLEIEQPLIEKWVREGRIDLVIDPEAEASKPKCARCGREIKQGQTYCRTCMFKQLQEKGKKSVRLEDLLDRNEGGTRHSGMHYKKTR